MRYPSQSVWWARTLRSARKLPADLGAVALLLSATDVVALAPGLRTTPLRPVFGLVLLFFAPGYVLLAVLYPVGGRRKTATGAARGVDWVERLALSVGASVALLSLSGLALAAAGFGFGTAPALAGVNAFVLPGVVLGTVRRWGRPERDRLRVPHRRWLDDLRAVTRGASRYRLLDVALAASVLVAAAALGFALAVPDGGESYTGFAVLSQNASGDLVAGDYPTEFVRGEPRPLTVAVTNHERERTRYTVVVEVHRVRTVGGDPTVTEQREVTRLRRTLSDGETWHARHRVAPALAGDSVRLEYYLYRGGAPADAGPETAYRRVFLWIHVAATDGGSA